jgi:hypothetical protein
LNHLNHLGADGFHWRVCIEDKQPSSTSHSNPSFSWWDIQDENARLPVKETAVSHIESMFMPSKKSSTSSSTDSSASKAAKGALKGLGKAFAGALDGNDSGPMVPIIAFKLLDLVKMNDDFENKHGGEKGHAPVAAPRAPPKPRAAPQHRTPAPTQYRTPAPHPTPQQQRPSQQQHAASVQRPAPARQPAAPHATANLMDFGTPAPAAHSGFHRSASMPAVPSNETRAEKLKREYAKKTQSSNRVWDDVDQRWVEVDPAAGFKAGSQSAPPEPSSSPSKKTVGIKLDPANAIGKSATVQAAVHARVNEMKQSQEKAVQEVREREAKKAASEAEEDEVRKRMEPRIKAWSEEHGKRKPLRALLASLHTILWPGANWKQLTIGDLLDDSKVKRAFFMASRVVHPDKTGDLDAEKRFLAKRVFDALSQAKTDFDSGGK